MRKFFRYLITSFKASSEKTFTDEHMHWCVLCFYWCDRYVNFIWQPTYFNDGHEMIEPAYAMIVSIWTFSLNNNNNNDVNGANCTDVSIVNDFDVNHTHSLLIQSTWLYVYIKFAISHSQSFVVVQRKFSIFHLWQSVSLSFLASSKITHVRTYAQTMHVSAISCSFFAVVGFQNIFAPICLLKWTHYFFSR